MRALLLPLVLVSLTVLAQAPPPSPSAPRAPWACDRASLLADRICTFDGKTAAQPPSKEQAKEIRRDARALLLDLCAEVAQGRHHEMSEPHAALVAWCTARADAAVRVCGGDGSRRLTDDNGRFNPGHAPCYASLRAVLTDLESIAEDVSSCCGCAAEKCGASTEQCSERMVKGQVPDGTCAETCASSCAGAAARNAPAPRRKP